MNSRGQIVGTSMIGSVSSPDAPTYAAFSNATGGPHGPSNFSNSVVNDNLNNSISESLGINLTQGLKVDDLGRIIARGTRDGQDRDFLLVPAGLASDPIATPEPSTVLLFAAAAGAAGPAAPGLIPTRFGGVESVLPGRGRWSLRS